jgi:hypothetical protein
MFEKNINQIIVCREGKCFDLYYEGNVSQELKEKFEGGC